VRPPSCFANAEGYSVTDAPATADENHISSILFDSGEDDLL